VIDPDLIADQLLGGTVNVDSFGHQEHVAAAWALLRRYSFEKAAQRYVTSIRALTISAGAPGKFHMTVTLAFLSLIAERLAVTSETTFTDFAAENPLLMSASYLDRWYSKARLGSDIAR